MTTNAPLVEQQNHVCNNMWDRLSGEGPPSGKSLQYAIYAVTDHYHSIPLNIGKKDNCRKGRAAHEKANVIF